VRTTRTVGSGGRDQDGRNEGADEDESKHSTHPSSSHSPQDPVAIFPPSQKVMPRHCDSGEVVPVPPSPGSGICASSHPKAIERGCSRNEKPPKVDRIQAR
jgi:hypothetical protein